MPLKVVLHFLDAVNRKQTAHHDVMIRNPRRTIDEDVRVEEVEAVDGIGGVREVLEATHWSCEGVWGGMSESSSGVCMFTVVGHNIIA